MAGGPILALILLGVVAVLAEGASFLHLVIYGLICVALIALRRNEPGWYDPDFRVPGYPVTPALAAPASFAPIGFVRPASRLIGVAIMVLSAGWYYCYARDVALRGVL